MVFTLHRYVFRELAKVFILAAVALTLMLSLGSVIEPVQKYGVGPGHAARLMVYFLPITLTFVLPMAALFAGSLVYGRLASDNELDACRASGISLVTLVYPGLALAIIVAIANLVLSFHVMPAFVQRAEKSFKADAKQILFRNLQRRGYYDLPGAHYVIHADQADSESNTLSGVVIAAVKQNTIEKIIAAESATINFSPHEQFNEVQITAYKTYQMGPEDESGFSAELVPFKIEFPPLLGDDIKFKKVAEMKEIRDVDRMAFYPIRMVAADVYAQFTIELLAQDISSKTAGGEPNSFYSLRCGDKTVDFSAQTLRMIPGQGGPDDIELSGKVVVRDTTKQPPRTYRCERATLHLEGDKLAPTLTMVLYDASWVRPDGLPGWDRRPIIYGLLIPAGIAPESFLPQAVRQELQTENQAIIRAIEPDAISGALRAGPSEKLAALRRELSRKIRVTLTEIKAEIHSRLVFGIGCVSMIMIGIGLGIIKKDGHLLSAFGASCIPAAVLVICIMMGKNITKNAKVQVIPGVALMWVGLVLLTVVGLLIYRRLLRN